MRSSELDPDQQKRTPSFGFFPSFLPPYFRSTRFRPSSDAIAVSAMYHSRRSSRSGDEHLYTTAIDLDLNPNAYLDDEKGNASSSSNEDLPIARGLPSKWTNRREKHGAMSAKTKSILQVVLVVVGTVIGWTGNEWTRFLENGEGAGGSLNASNRT